MSILHRISAARTSALSAFALTISVFGASTAVVTPAPEAKSPPHTCAPRKAIVFQQRGGVTIFGLLVETRDPNTRQWHHVGDIVGCSAYERRWWGLTSDGYGDNGADLTRIRGHFAASAQWPSVGDGSYDGPEALGVRSMRTGTWVFKGSAGCAVTDMELSLRGKFAFIGTCTKWGGPSVLVAQASARGIRALDSGDGVDIHSLRVNGESVSWVKNGSRKRAVLRKRTTAQMGKRSADASARRCRARHSRLVRSRGRTRIFRLSQRTREPLTGRPYYAGDTLGCITSVGRWRLLTPDERQFGDQFQLSGITGRFAYATQALSEHPGAQDGYPGQYVLGVRDLRSGRWVTSDVGDNPDFRVDPADVVLTKSGKFVFIEAEPSSMYPFDLAKRHYNVIQGTSGGNRMLASGAGVDSHSLRITGNVAKWTVGGAPQSAALK